MINPVKYSYKVYVHIFPKELTGKKYDKYYFGITCRSNVNDRWVNGNGYVKQPYFYNAIQKYGWDNIRHVILFENLDEEMALLIEAELIDKFKTTSKEHGYNVSFGGKGFCKNVSSKDINVYCIELNMAFRNARVASAYTGDSEDWIKGCCRYRETQREISFVNKRNKNKYLYIHTKDMWKLFKGQKMHMDLQSKPLIYLPYGQVTGNIITTNYYLHTNFSKKGIFDYEKYISYEEKGRLNKRPFLMVLSDYLKMFDYTSPNIPPICDFKNPVYIKNTIQDNRPKNKKKHKNKFKKIDDNQKCTA